jgi:hypothetical protein
MHERFMPPPKPDALVRPAPAADRSDARRWLSAAIATTLALASLCFTLLLLVDRRYGWPAYATLFTASMFTLIRDKVS